MKDFFRRLKYYGLGFSIGAIMVVFMFDNKGCSWFPSNRVKDNLFNRMIVVNQEANAEIKEQGFTEAQFLKTIQEGSVDFGKSKKQGLDKPGHPRQKITDSKKFINSLIFFSK